MAKFVCDVCGYVYDEDLGGVGKDQFSPAEEE